MNLFQAFERFYLINLPERSDRLHETLAELQRVGVQRDDPRLRIFAAIKPADAGVFPSRGARGCYLSHLVVIREAIRDGVENVLVIEDDVALSAACAAVAPDFAAALSAPDWDFAYPGHVEQTEVDAKAPPRWQHTRAPLACTHFYALNRRVLPALAAYLEACMLRPPGHPDGGPMHVDGAYSMFRAREAGVVTLVAAPSLAGQRSSRSDIYPNRWYDRLPLARNLVGFARKARNRARRRSEPALCADTTRRGV